jgi:lipopolysaccharide export system protein LptA
MHRAPLLALALTALVAAGSAQAQLPNKSGGGLLGPHGQGPLGINSDSWSYDPDACLAIWKGRVEATQDQTRMRADQVNVYNHRTGPKTCTGDYDRMEANGNVFYVTPDLKAKGDKAVYLVANDTVTITGRVIVTSDQGVTETNKLVLNVNTNEATMGDAVPGQRVKAVIYPNKKAPAAK